MNERLQTLLEPEVPVGQENGEQLLRCAQGTASPAALLFLIAGNGRGHLPRAVEVSQIQDPVALYLDAVAGIQVFGQGIRLPSTRLQNSLRPEDSAAAIEILQTSRGISPGLLDQEVDIDPNGNRPS